MKRFYKEVQVQTCGSGCVIELDYCPILTPGKNKLILPNRRLADSVAAEWARQGEKIQPNTMPFMSFSSTAIDRIQPNPNAVVISITEFTKTDLLCYRADDPKELIDRQNLLWQPLVDWCSALVGHSFKVTTGIIPIEQTSELIQAMGSLIQVYDEFFLIILHQLTTISGSIIIALAIVEGYMEIEEGVQAAYLDELFQIERWGEDAEASLRIANMREEMLEVGSFLGLVSSQHPTKS